MKTKFFKKTISTILIFILLAATCLSAASCSKEYAWDDEDVTYVEFTDSCGRAVEVPDNITRVAMSGSLTQMILFALCPDKLVGLASSWDAEAEEYIDTEYFNLPVLGQLYGGSGDLNVETILKTGAQIIIDVGEDKTSMEEDLDDLQGQLGIPCVHISADTDTMGEAYRTLGSLLNMEEEAEVLASYCEEIYGRTLKISQSVEKVNLLYINGDLGLNVTAYSSYQSQIIDLLSNNLAVVNNPSAKGIGNEVDMEQILKWNPDVILFAPGSIYDSVFGMSEWQTITAIKDGDFYEVPYGPYNWMGFPPSVQRYLGMMWMAKLLYPEEATYDLYEEVSRYFELFYHAKITKEQYYGMLENSITKKFGRGNE